MDIKDLMGTLLSSDSLKGLSGITGTSQKDVKNVLSSALPSILDGVMGQANDTQTAEGFVGALSDHAKDDTSDLSSFLSGIDLEDGGKIIAHLLGGNAEKTTEAAAEKAGVEKGKAGSILSAAAPLLMSLLGQTASSDDNAESNNASGIGGLMGSLLGNVDLGGLLGGLLGGGDSDEGGLTEITNNGGKKKKSKKKKKTDKKDDKGGLLSTILGFFKG